MQKSSKSFGLAVIYSLSKKLIFSTLANLPTSLNLNY